MKKICTVLLIATLFCSCEKEIGSDNRPANCYDVFKSRVVELRSEQASGEMSGTQYDSAYLAESAAMYRCQIGE